jgi:hypothetical protein
MDYLQDQKPPYAGGGWGGCPPIRWCETGAVLGSEVVVVSDEPHGMSEVHFRTSSRNGLLSTAHKVLGGIPEHYKEEV